MGMTRFRKWLPLIGLIAAGTAAVWLVRWRQERAEIATAFAIGKVRIGTHDYEIVAGQNGRIATVLVAAGDLVRAGQAVALMDTADLEAEVHRAEIELKQARDGKQQARASIARWESEIEQALAAIPQLESEASAAKAKAERSEALFQQQYISRREFERDQTQKQTAETSLAYTLARKEVAEAALKAAQIQIVKRDAAIAAAEQKIRRLNSEIAGGVLTAPVRGRVRRRYVEPDAILTAGDKVMALLPLDETSVTISLPASQAARAIVGSQARVVFDGAPAHVIAAAVAAIAPEPDRPSEKKAAASVIKIKIDPEALPDTIIEATAELNGTVYVRLDPGVPWPDHLRLKAAP